MSRRPLQDIKNTTQPIERMVTRSRANRDRIPAPTLRNLNKENTKGPTEGGASKKAEEEGQGDNEENVEGEPLINQTEENSCVLCQKAIGRIFFRCGAVSCHECSATPDGSCPMCREPNGTCRVVPIPEVADIIKKHFAVDIPKRKSKSILIVPTKLGIHKLPCVTIDNFVAFNDALTAGSHVDDTNTKGPTKGGASGKAGEQGQGHNEENVEEEPPINQREENSCVLCQNAIGRMFFRCGAVSCRDFSATLDGSCMMYRKPPGTCRVVPIPEVADIIKKHFAVDIPKRKSISVLIVSTKLGIHKLPCVTIDNFVAFNDALTAGSHVDDSGNGKQ